MALLVVDVNKCAIAFIGYPRANHRREALARVCNQQLETLRAIHRDSQVRIQFSVSSQRNHFVDSHSIALALSRTADDRSLCKASQPTSHADRRYSPRQ